MNNILDYLNKDEAKLIKYIDVVKGNIIFKEEEICRYFAMVVKGEVSISSYLYNGKEIIYNKIGKNEVFGNNLLFSSKPFYRGDVIALTNSRIALINKNDLLSLFHSNQKFLEEYLRFNSEFSKKLNAKIKLLSMASAEERFFYYMQMHDNAIIYKSITSLSKDIYLERETLSRLLTKLVKEGKIDKKNHSIRMIV